MSDLSQAIGKLRSLSPQLNAAAIEADRVVNLVERFLVNECGLAVEAEVPLHYNEKGKAVTLLRYASSSGAFRICVTHTDGSTHFVTRPWVECDRNQRIISFTALPKLLIAIAKAVEAQIVSTTQTANTVGQIINALGASASWSHSRENELRNPLSEPELTLLMGDADDRAQEAADAAEAMAPATALPTRVNGHPSRISAAAE